MLEVFAIEPLAVALQSRRDDERVIPSHTKTYGVGLSP
jgi:hypothetical protein